MIRSHSQRGYDLRHWIAIARLLTRHPFALGSWGGSEDGAIWYPAEQKCLISHTNDDDANKGNSSNVTTDVPNVASPFFDFSNVTADVVSHSFECVRGYWWWTAEDTFWTVILLLLVLGCCISCCFIAATTQRVPNSRFAEPSPGLSCSKFDADVESYHHHGRLFSFTLGSGTVSEGVQLLPSVFRIRGSPSHPQALVVANLMLMLNRIITMDVSFPSR